MKLFSSRGEVLSMQPLIVDEAPAEGGSGAATSADFGGIENLCIVAMATVSKVIVISVRPTLFVHFTFLLKVKRKKERINEDLYELKLYFTLLCY